MALREGRDWKNSIRVFSSLAAVAVVIVPEGSAEAPAESSSDLRKTRCNI